MGWPLRWKKGGNGPYLLSRLSGKLFLSQLTVVGAVAPRELPI